MADKYFSLTLDVSIIIFEIKEISTYILELEIFHDILNVHISVR